MGDEKNSPHACLANSGPRKACEQVGSPSGNAPGVRDEREVVLASPSLLLEGFLPQAGDRQVGVEPACAGALVESIYRARQGISFAITSEGPAGQASATRPSCPDG